MESLCDHWSRTGFTDRTMNLYIVCSIAIEPIAWAYFSSSGTKSVHTLLYFCTTRSLVRHCWEKETFRWCRQRLGWAEQWKLPPVYLLGMNFKKWTWFMSFRKWRQALNGRVLELIFVPVLLYRWSNCLGKSSSIGYICSTLHATPPAYDVCMNHRDCCVPVWHLSDTHTPSW